MKKALIAILALLALALGPPHCSEPPPPQQNPPRPRTRSPKKKKSKNSSKPSLI